MSWFFLFFN